MLFSVSAGQVPAEGMPRGAGDRDRAGDTAPWLCSRWRYEVLFVQVLLRAGKEGRLQSARSERPVLLLKQLQRKKPGSQSHRPGQLLLSPPLHVAVAPAVEADMRGEERASASNKSAFSERGDHVS